MLTLALARRNPNIRAEAPKPPSMRLLPHGHPISLNDSTTGMKQGAGVTYQAIGQRKWSGLRASK